MKNKILLFIFLTYCGQAFTADLCVGQGLRYGNGEGNDMISPSCIAQLKESDVSVKKQFVSGVSVFGHKDILLIEKPGYFGRPLIIAGSSTRLDNILTIALDDANGELFVLDQSGEVLSFSPDKTGNISPLRVLKTDLIVGATDLKVLPLKNQVAVLKSSERRILFYSRNSNFRARHDKRKLELLKTVNIPTNVDVSVYFQNLN